MTTRRKRILVVDDNKSLVMVMQTILQKEGYDVITALDGSEAVATIGAAIPDLVILDINMPGVSGYDVCQQLHDDPRTARVPVVFLSSRGNTDERKGAAGVGLKEIQQAYSVGAADFLHKPISSKELLTTVKSILALDRIVSQG